MNSVEIKEGHVNLSGENIEELVSDFSRFYILTILYEGPTHGYNIIRRFRKRLKKGVSPSLVYPFLQRLEEKGLLKHTIKHVGEKERKVYKLTEAGNELCSRLFKRFADITSTAIEPNLSICAHCGCKLYEGGYQESLNGKMFTFCCKHCAASYKREKEETQEEPIFR